MTTRQVQEIRASEVRELLKQGVTRFRADDEGFGSIEEKYNLTPAGVRRLFQNEELKGLKTIVPEFVYINDIPAGESEVEDAVEELPATMQEVYDEMVKKEEEKMAALAHDEPIRLADDEVDRPKLPSECSPKEVSVFE